MRTFTKAICTVLAAIFATTILSVTSFAENDEVFVPNLPVWSGEIATEFGGGDGTKSNPFLISNGEQLALLMKKINDTVSEAEQTTEGEYYKLTNDILLNDVSDFESWSETNAPENVWIPGGAVVNYTPIGFAGYFDGNNYDIIGMYVCKDSSYNGLFGYMYNGQVKNLGIKNAYVKGGSTTGALSGYIRSTTRASYVSGCTVSDSRIYGRNNVGAFGGYIEAYYKNIFIDKCSFIGASEIVGNNYVGGIAGLITAFGIKFIDDEYAVEITNCINSAGISGKNSIGGIVGSSKDFVSSFNNSEKIALLIENCVSNGAIVCTGSKIGSIIGVAGPDGREDSNVYINIKSCYGNENYSEALYGYTLSDTDTSTSSLIDNTEMATKETFDGFDFDDIWTMATMSPIIRKLGDALGDGVLTAKDFIDVLAAFTGEKNVEDDFILQNIDFDGNGTYDLADVNQFMEYLKNKGATKYFSADALRVARSTVKFKEDGDVAYNMDVYSPGVGKLETYKAYSIANIGDIVTLNGDGEVRDRVYGNIYTPGNICEIGSDNIESLGYVKVASYDDTTRQLTVEGSDEIYNLTDSTVVTFSDKFRETFLLKEFDIFSSTSKIYRQNDDKNEPLRVFLCVKKVGEENKVLYAVVVRG